MGREKGSGHDFTVAERPGGPLGCHLAAYIIRSPGHVQQPLRSTQKKLQPFGTFLLVYTKEGHTEAPEENTPVSSSGLWVGALCCILGLAYGEYHEAGAEMLMPFPAHIF